MVGDGKELLDQLRLQLTRQMREHPPSTWSPSLLAVVANAIVIEFSALIKVFTDATRADGELRETPKGWAVQAPEECINGHPLGTGQVLVGNEPCTCSGGHMGWTCRECGETFLWPPESPVCSVLNGPGLNRPSIQGGGSAG